MPHEPGPLFPFPDDKVRVTPAADAVELAVGGTPVRLTFAEARAVAIRLTEADSPAEQQQEWQRVPMQFLLLAVEQTNEDGDTESAEVGCWVADQTRVNAFHIAHGWVSANGWEVLEVLDHYPVTRASYDDEPHLLPYYEQAITDGEVFLYEIDDPTEDTNRAS